MLRQLIAPLSALADRFGEVSSVDMDAQIAATLDVTQAQDWAMQIMEVAEADARILILVIADMARSKERWTGVYASRP